MFGLMRFSAAGWPGSCKLLRICVIMGLLAGFALSPKLWLSSRLYPLTPVWPFLKPLGPPADRMVFGALLVLLIALLAVWRRGILAAVFALLLLLALQDESRWQPWFYQYAFMLLAIALAGRERPSAARNTCRLIVAATYIWSGLAKLNANFFENAFAWLVGPLVKGWPAPAHAFVNHLAFVAPCLECAVGIGLLSRRLRPAAVFFAIAMHAFILLAIGPLGLNYNDVVWPWNLAMMAFVPILFFRTADRPTMRDIVWGRGFAFQKVVLVLFALAPILSFFGRWDDYLSSALYSGNTNFGWIRLNDDAFNRLPDGIDEYVTTAGPNLNEIDLDDWSLGELGVPAYPEIRVFRSVARAVCGFTADAPSVKLVVKRKRAFAIGRRESVYGCADLRRSESGSESSQKHEWPRMNTNKHE